MDNQNFVSSLNGFMLVVPTASNSAAAGVYILHRTTRHLYGYLITAESLNEHRRFRSASSRKYIHPTCNLQINSSAIDKDMMISERPDFVDIIRNSAENLPYRLVSGTLAFSPSEVENKVNQEVWHLRLPFPHLVYSHSDDEKIEICKSYPSVRSDAKRVPEFSINFIRYIISSEYFLRVYLCMNDVKGATTDEFTTRRVCELMIEFEAETRISSLGYMPKATQRDMDKLEDIAPEIARLFIPLYNSIPNSLIDSAKTIKELDSQCQHLKCRLAFITSSILMTLAPDRMPTSDFLETSKGKEFKKNTISFAAVVRAAAGDDLPKE